MTKHNHGANFGKFVANCERCIELKNGAEPVKGWGFHNKQNEMNRIKAIREHDCVKSNCGVVCTAFDW